MAYIGVQGFFLTNSDSLGLRRTYIRKTFLTKESATSGVARVVEGKPRFFFFFLLLSFTLFCVVSAFC